MSYIENNDVDKKEFLTYLKSNITDFLPSGISENAKVEIREIVKSNDQMLTSVNIYEPNRNVSPSIYVDEMIDDYKNGASIDVLMSKIVDIYMAHRNPNVLSFDFDKVTDYESIKDMLVTKVINTELSNEFLENIPHKTFGDLAVISQIRLFEQDGDMASITVNDELLEKWDKSFDEVIEIASQNDLKLTEPKLVPMYSVLAGLMYGEEYEQEGFLPSKDDPLSIPMYVLQTSDKLNGAKLLNQPELMDTIAEFFGSDFIVLPSSINESIIIPQGESTFNMAELGQMVRDVNGSEVKPEEILSDHAYVYSKEEKVLTFEKDGETIVMNFTKEAKKEVPKKEGIKAKLKEGIEKSKAQDASIRVPKKSREMSLE